MTKPALIFTVAFGFLFLAEAHARVDKFLETPKKFTAMCKDGSKSRSSVSQRKAACGCAKKGGAVGQSAKTCASG